VSNEPSRVATEVIVVGSGAAALCAAIAARDAGRRVTVLEKSAHIGGTTAVSGGVIWIPNNHDMAALGLSDSRDEAAGYIEYLAAGRSERALIHQFVETAPQMLGFLEARAGLQFSAIPEYPDYHPEFPGARAGGRSVEAGLFDTTLLGQWAPRLRRSPILGFTPMLAREAVAWDALARPAALPYATFAERSQKGIVAGGAALVGWLLKACIALGVELQLQAPARELVTKNGRVVGVLTQSGQEFAASQGVVLASGGFEWSPDLKARFLAGPLTHPNSPPFNTGDGLTMGMALGADLANMSEVWGCPSLVVPGEESDGAPLSRADFSIRSLPHSIIVNRRGQRFVNEAHNYNDVAKAFLAFDAVAYEHSNLPCWLILDQSYCDKYALLTSMPGRPAPKWVERADTLPALADNLGIVAAGLVATVHRFNAHAKVGSDPDFQRGKSVYDHFHGDRAHTPNPNLGSIERPPFYALRVHPGALGTKGGLRTNAQAQVMHVRGEVIPGLYAAGNVMAGVTGAGYPGAGATIGPAMTWGTIAGTHVANHGRAARRSSRKDK
jgi:3-oxosteroid 1-dehydrogenase